ncbi:MAG: RnfH family protein [Rhodanobacter sp.]|nr:MAG: RnfH family protein [Rhodanobacter sp.]TAM09972.1 MAG: RnfH family protein [Rhodanobacter sp.]TAM34667.1 MAG: RnfH family protein [Rhodanobacter sp.]
MPEPHITVEIVHAGVDRCWRCKLDVAVGSTVGQALEVSGVLVELPADVVQPLRVGIYAHPVRLDRVLRDGERIEIYRSLTFDPMAARRRRASGL